MPDGRKARFRAVWRNGNPAPGRLRKGGKKEAGGYHADIA